jgi:antitoxin component YwqK of YwqJK toxin-antitoxin module
MNLPLASRLLWLPLLLWLGACENRETVTETTENGFRETFQINKKTRARDGQYEKFRPDGTLLQRCTFRDGLLNGKLTLFYASGKPMQEETYRDDKLEGTVYAWYESGVLESEEPYVNSRHEGVLKRYYENGQLKVSMTMANGVENGPVKRYWPNGQLQEEGTFQIGVHSKTGLSNENFDEKWHGERKQYDENGQLVRVQNCEYGFCNTTWQRETQ